MIGITIGCLVGMLPLLFYDGDDKTSSTASTAAAAAADVTQDRVKA